ncbi:MAG: neutral/alkaline non-lysosomal ceramidase N-terminal domain-containing protein [Gammaproteobacteria bacterium]|nr:neutral/alkaline non-lysosomal ceramidase N-terminal domain-containing protein [Gammaproteobacteria bacterium]
MRALFSSAVLVSAAVLVGCGSNSPDLAQSPLNGNPVEQRACSLGHLSDNDIVSIQRTPADLPLQDLSHYQARNATRGTGIALNSGACESNTTFRYAAGLGDITGATAGSSMAGYVDSDQISSGLIDRQHARAFIFQSNCGGQDSRAVIVQNDLGLMFTSIRQGVLDALAADNELGGFYNRDNVVLNPSHSHSTAGGQSHHDAYHVLTGGHDPQNLAAAINGIMAAIRRAHNNLANATDGPILFSQAELLNGTTNRSVPAYLENPEADRNAFLDTDGNEVRTNRMMSLLKLQRDNGTEVGMVNWYGIHVTSIYQNNTLLSADNKGYAALRFEQDFDTEYFSANQAEPFLAGFMQADEGDASPSLFIPDLTEAELRDLEGDAFRNRAGGRTEPENALISGYKQYRHAKQLYDNANERLVGQVSAKAIQIDWSTVQIANPGNYPAELQPQAPDVYESCSGALGVSMAGGAEDGRGPASEGQTCANTQDPAEVITLLEDGFAAGQNGALPSGLLVPVGCDNAVYDALNYDCQAEKPILFPLNQQSPFNQPGGTQTLEPMTLPIQIVTLGNLAIIALPWEVTTNSGRRIRNVVLNELEDAGIDYAVISGLSNGFVHYLTTREEYSVQNYEGASTIFGPWTLEAVQQEMVRLAAHVKADTTPTSPYENNGYRSEVSTMVADTSANDGNPTDPFGTVTLQPNPSYELGDDRVTVTARFVGGHPRNDLKSEDSYFFVEQQQPDGSWQVAKRDNDWFTRYEYEINQFGANEFRVDWILPEDVEPGRYRIRHDGVAGSGAYSGTTDEFEVATCAQ